jgi:hypothetical protein
LSPYGGNALRPDESCKDLPRISPSKVEESMALLGKAHLFNKAADTGVFSDMIFGLFYEMGAA